MTSRFEKSMALRASLAAVVAAGAVVLFAEVKKHNPSTSSEASIDSIYQPTAIAIGRQALKKAKADHIPGSIEEDPDNKGTFNVLVETTDDSNNKHEILALMHEKAGRPDPSTTFEVLVQNHYGETKKISDQILIINDKEINNGSGWGAIYNSFSEENQKKAVDSATSEEMTGEGNRDIAKLARLLTQETVLLPSHVPHSTTELPSTGANI